MKQGKPPGKGSGAIASNNPANLEKLLLKLLNSTSIRPLSPAPTWRHCPLVRHRCAPSPFNIL
jgi:hypothetical protein